MALARPADPVHRAPRVGLACPRLVGCPSTRPRSVPAWTAHAWRRTPAAIAVARPGSPVHGRGRRGFLPDASEPAADRRARPGLDCAASGAFPTATATADYQSGAVRRTGAGAARPGRNRCSSPKPSRRRHRWRRRFEVRRPCSGARRRLPGRRGRRRAGHAAAEPSPANDRVGSRLDRAALSQSPPRSQLR